MTPFIERGCYWRGAGGDAPTPPAFYFFFFFVPVFFFAPAFVFVCVAFFVAACFFIWVVVLAPLCFFAACFGFFATACACVFAFAWCGAAASAAAGDASAATTRAAASFVLIIWTSWPVNPCLRCRRCTAGPFTRGEAPVNLGSVAVTVLVDAENVRRSRWPNVSRGQLVELVRAWGERRGVAVIVVFDGRAPEEAADVVGAGGSADDWLAGHAVEHAPCWLVTSDRELRQRVGAAAERVIGGGAFLGELLDEQRA